MSRPPQKARSPAPVNITADMPSRSRKPSNIALISRYVSRASALTGGRSITTSARPPSSVTRNPGIMANTPLVHRPDGNGQSAAGSGRQTQHRPRPIHLSTLALTGRLGSRLWFWGVSERGPGSGVGDENASQDHVSHPIGDVLGRQGSAGHVPARGPVEHACHGLSEHLGRERCVKLSAPDAIPDDGLDEFLVASS